jgi:uncharacterized alkaline shock family protein YloU
MSERGQQWSGSPLESERGSTYIEDSVVSKLAGMAAGEVEGVHMGSSTSRAAGGILGSVTGSQGLSRGVSVEVGRIETAIDVTMEVEYGRNILQLAERVRERITERVESLTGLRITELTVTVNDVIFPDGEERGGRGARRRSEPEDRTPEQRTEEIGAGGREREDDDTKPIDPGAARSEAITRAGRRFGEETIRPDDVPLDEDETAELRLDDETGRGRRREE